jgi:6,7-dimethyl-8-ribityllumazine synthase
VSPRRVNSIDPSGVRIAFIQSSWHKDLLLSCRQSFIRVMGKSGYAKNRIDYFDVPGAFEIPLQAKILARSGKYAAIVANGLVVDGGIYRHEFVASAVVSGLMQVQLETEVPVISVVLTPHQFHEHDTHKVFFREHLKIKGEEAAATCIATLSGLAKLRCNAR